MLSDPEVSEDTADTFRSLHAKMSECVLDVFRTEYKTIVCVSVTGRYPQMDAIPKFLTCITAL